MRASSIGHCAQIYDTIVTEDEQNKYIYIYKYNKLFSHQHDGCDRPRYDAGQQEVQELVGRGLAEHGLEGLVEAELQRPL